ncbi:MAG: hypothetical protein COV45_00900 [Deltaproteobacteria bacterium CG11_big_fil_rev_8_21_14_0_20_47_16]|nr:MAG: hypothetical protein COV45_00900 [Deltaproteobacteria bacterium CG11_big_fil_rev_8_21_14_0_20_47_16]
MSITITTHNNIFIRTQIIPDAAADVWFLHGIGESGLSFIEAFESPLAKSFNLYVPDMPGFGASPYPDSHPDQKQTADMMDDVIRSVSGDRPVYLVGHSQGGLVGTWLCQKLGDQVKGYVNVEGNLTSADVVFSGEMARQPTPEACKTHVIQYLQIHAQGESYWRYYASIRFAFPDALLTWARAGLAFTGDTKSGEEYAALPVRKLFVGGIKSRGEKTSEFIKSHKLNFYGFENSGHWPMIDATDVFYNKVLNFITSI